MSNINMRVSKRGVVTWQVVLRKAGRPTLSGTFSDRKEAEFFKSEALARIDKEERREQKRLAPSLDLPPSGNLEDEKLADTFAMFAASASCTGRHVKLMPAIVRNIGDSLIKDLKPSWGMAYAARMRKQLTMRKTIYSYQSIVSHLSMINVVLKWRADDLDMSPPRLRFDTKKFPKDWAVKRTRRLEAGEESALLKRLAEIDSPSSPHWVLLVKLAIETGARLQELVLSTWREVNIEGGFWTIPKAHTKSKKERVVPLTTGADAAFKELAKIADPANARVFHTLKSPGSVSCIFHRRTQEAGLIDFRFHDLRHEAISRFVLEQRNFSVYEIMQMVGHSSPAMLVRYSNLRGDELAMKIIRTKKANSPGMSIVDVNRFAHDFAAIRVQAPITKPAGPKYGVGNASSVYLDAGRTMPLSPVA